MAAPFEDSKNSFMRYTDAAGNLLIALVRDGTVKCIEVTFADGTTQTTAGSSAGSAFIDSTTGVVTTNTNGPFLAAGSYVIKTAITDGAGRWSNFVEWDLTADGSHNYNISYEPPMTLWSLAPGTQFSNIFTNNANISAWVSFNGGPFLRLTASAASLAYYNFWNPNVFIGGGYTTDSTPMPTPNTLPAINLAVGGPCVVATGVVLNAPQMGLINIAPSSLDVNQGNLAMQTELGNTLFIGPDNSQGMLLFEQNGVRSGILIFGDVADGSVKLQGRAGDTIAFMTGTAPGGGSQSTVGPAGSASALPGAPQSYLKININGNNYVIPYWKAS